MKIWVCHWLGGSLATPEKVPEGKMEDGRLTIELDTVEQLDALSRKYDLMFRRMDDGRGNKDAIVLWLDTRGGRFSQR